MDIIKYYIPIIDDCLCNINKSSDELTIMSKQKFFDTCIPLFNMETFNAFIIFKDTDDHMISINTPNSFVVKNKCLKESDSKGYIIDFKPSISNFNCKGVDIQRKDFFKSICFDEKDPNFKLDNTIRDVNNFLISNINYELDFEGKLIPFYYFFLNSYDIFNLFISNSYTLANNYFKIERELKRFVSISDNINIFNLSIFTYKYIDILNLFHDVFQWKQTLQYGSNKEKFKKTNDKRDELIDRLDKIFQPIQEFVIAIWNLYKFKKFIASMGAYDINAEYCKTKSSRDECDKEEKCSWKLDKNICVNKISDTLRDRYLKSPIGECEFLCESKIDENLVKNFWDSEEYKNSPFSRPGKGPKAYSFKDMLWEMASEILTLSDVLVDLSYSVNIPEYKYIFLIQMLSFRLLKKKFLTGNWGFLYNKYLSMLEKHRLHKEKYNLDPEMFINSKFPVIYEFNNVQFMGKTYGNCMENTILQFFKLLFWNIEDRNIDIQLVNSIVRSQYKKQMKEFLEHIDKEREQEYLKRWVKFISYDVNRDKSYFNIEYKFVNEGKDEQDLPIPIEINSTFDNLYIALIKVLNIEVDESQHKEDIINDFLSNNDLFIKNIIIENESNKDIVKVYTSTKEYVMELIYDTHAYFIEAEDNDTKYIVPYHFSDYSISMWENLQNEIKPEFYKNFFQYALLKIMFTQGRDNGNLFTNYKNINEEIVSSIYFKLFENPRRIYASNTIYKNDILFEYIYKCIPQIIYDKNFIKRSKTSIQFWTMIGNDNKALIWFTDKNLWSYIIDNIYINDFWSKVSNNKSILDIFTKQNLWDKIISVGFRCPKEEFWTQVATHKDILNIFTLQNLWEQIIYNVKSEKFWKQISEHSDIVNEFTKQNLWKKLLNIDIESKKDLWIRAGKQHDILDNFTQQNLWRDIIIAVNIEEFWYEVSNNPNIINEFTRKKLWSELITHKSKITKFWDHVSDNNIVIDYFIKSGLDYNKIESFKFKRLIEQRKFKPFISII
jgi:hypothetical protein